MTLQRIYITRHGFRSNWDVDAPPKPIPTNIDGDFVLSAHGEEQAAELCKRLASIQPAIERVYCSPFYRCLQTVGAFTESAGLDLLPENGVGEWYGITRATHPTAASAQVLHRFFPSVPESYTPIMVPSSQGESFDELHQRAQDILAEIIRRANADGIKTLLICSHAATIHALSRALVGDPSFTARTGTCSLALYELNPEYTSSLPGNWICVQNGDSTHLTLGEERHWDFETGNYDFLDVQTNRESIK
ncbi:histidine phosphatase superfamily [Lipomyces oligophaga]|uniref:histidine phosphatase superfamily n=1 Tax=Lipomyces oligophaga TaxID=45792 RepID=UPI0034CE0D9F